MKPLKLTMIFVALPLVLAAPNVHAAVEQPKEKYLPAKPTDSKMKEKGWGGSVNLGGSFSFSSSSNVVGQPDGISLSFGAQLTAALGYRKGVHEWRNKLKLAETFTKTADIDDIIKSNDIFSIESIYLYHLKAVPWFGPFIRLNIDTQIFAGHDVRSKDVEYVLNGVVGDPSNPTNDKFRLSDPFGPAHFKQQLGVFAKPVEKEWLNLEFKLGFAMRETLAKDQWAVDDNKDTADSVELKALDDFYQGGPALGVSADGAFWKGKATYFAAFETMVPVINQVDTSLVDLWNFSVEAGISFKLISWLSLDYQFRALLEPQLVDKWQIQNNILISVAYSLIDG